MIRKRGKRFSEKIMLKKLERGADRAISSFRSKPLTR
jgi:hypothetical protein